MKKKNIVEENSENDEEHNDENYDYITDRSFEAFVTVIEISIFGFENSTLVRSRITDMVVEYIYLPLPLSSLLCFMF